MAVLYKSAKVYFLLTSSHASLKSLKSRDVAMLRSQVIFWVTIALLDLAEGVSDRILQWVPFYNTIKFTALALLMVTKQTGTYILYRDHIRPFIRAHEPTIELWLKKHPQDAGKAALATLQRLYLRYVLASRDVISQPSPTPSHDESAHVSETEADAVTPPLLTQSASSPTILHAQLSASLRKKPRTDDLATDGDNEDSEDGLREHDLVGGVIVDDDSLSF
ncbi:hypothetical protein RI367_001421 [Sorochytrium milnesiophthora]